MPPLLAAGFGASTLGAFVIATTVGLFGVHEHWVGAYVWIAAVSEVVALVGGLVLLLRPGTERHESRRSSRSTGCPWAVSTSTEAMSRRLSAVAALSRMGLPATGRQVPDPLGSAVGGVHQQGVGAGAVPGG